MTLDVSLLQVLEHASGPLLGCILTNNAAMQDPSESSAGPFEDEQTRVFYETLPDLRGTIPGALLGSQPSSEARPSDEHSHTEDGGEDAKDADAAGARVRNNAAGWEFPPDHER